MNYKNRVLGPNGFEAFPEKLERDQIRQGHTQPRQDAGDTTASDLPPHGVQGKKELAKQQAIQAAAQKEYERLVLAQKRLPHANAHLDAKIAEAKAKANKKNK